MKTIGVRIALPEDLHTALKAAAEKDERKLAVFIVRLLRAHREAGIVHQAASNLKTALERDRSRVPDDSPPETAVLSPHEDRPLAEWPDERLVAEIHSKRGDIQSFKNLIANLPSGPETEKRKAELEQALMYVGILERESMKRRGKVQRKAPQLPRPNPSPQP